MKIASWNVNSLRVRLPHVLEWLDEARPDLLALQETKLTDEQFPAEAIHDAGYHVAHAGQATYNGVAVVSRWPLDAVMSDIPGLDDEARRILGATVGELRLLNLYVPNGKEVGSDKYDYKLRWMRALAEHIADEMQGHRYYVVVGDFNVAPSDADVHAPELWEERILCSTPEREAFNRLLETGLEDTFRLFDQPAETFSWWDYRGSAFRYNRGLRIDHILANPALAQRCRWSTVDIAPRRRGRPSDHAPVVAEFDLD